MPSMVSDRRSSFGMSCAQCGKDLIAPEWSEFRNSQQIRYLWRCWKCDYFFETVIDTKSVAAGHDDFPSLLVA
jgi:hypothetical protein